MKKLTTEQKLRKIICSEIKKLRNESKFDFDRLNLQDPIKNSATKNFKLVRFAYNDEGDNAIALLDLKNKKIISYSLTGSSEFEKFEALTSKIKKESEGPSDDLYNTIMKNIISATGGILHVDEKNKEIYIWQQDIRLLKPAINVFLKGLKTRYGFSIKLKDESPKFNKKLAKESITGEVVFSTNGNDNSIIKVTELPNGVIQIYKNGNRTNWKAVQDLVNSKDRKEISRYILSGENVMKEESNSPYKQKVFKFLDHPWQEDIEIEIIGLISEYRKDFLTGEDSTIRSYLKRLVERNNMLSGSYVAMLSDRFVDALEELIK